MLPSIERWSTHHAYRCQDTMMMEQMLPLNLAILQCALNAQCTQPIVHCAHLQNSIPHILVLNVHGPVQHVQAPRPALHVLQASL